jgi:hypothetical protein
MNSEILQNIQIEVDAWEYSLVRYLVQLGYLSLAQSSHFSPEKAFGFRVLDK